MFAKLTVSGKFNNSRFNLNNSLQIFFIFTSFKLFTSPLLLSTPLRNNLYSNSLKRSSSGFTPIQFTLFILYLFKTIITSNNSFTFS